MTPLATLSSDSESDRPTERALPMACSELYGSPEAIPWGGVAVIFYGRVAVICMGGWQ